MMVRHERGRLLAACPCVTAQLMRERRPLGTGLQEQVSSHLRRLGSKAPVVSTEGKGSGKPDQTGERKMNASEPLKTCRKRSNEIKTRGSRCLGKSVDAICLRATRSPALRWHESLMRQLSGTWEPSGSMLTEQTKRQPREVKSREATQRGGMTRSSNEAPDKRVERRGHIEEGDFNEPTWKGRSR